MRLFLAAAALIAFSSHGLADVIKLEYPGGDDLSRPILEFRARSPDTDHIGHAFVFLGRKLQDGSTIFYGAGGFYPQADTLKAVLKSPGHVDYTVDDMRSDIRFQVKISAEQERLVQHLILNWNQKEYSILSQNCVSLVQSVARVLGLDAGNELTPYAMVQHLKNENTPERPLQYAVMEGERGQAARARAAADVKSTIEHIIEHQKQVRQSQAAWQRFEHGMGSVGVGIRMSPSGTAGPGSNPFPLGTMMYQTWPWEPPSNPNK